jgi:hypothetical protein
VTPVSRNTDSRDSSQKKMFDASADIPKGLKARKKIAQGKRSETSAALGKTTKPPSPERAAQI